MNGMDRLVYSPATARAVCTNWAVMGVIFCLMYHATLMDIPCNTSCVQQRYSGHISVCHCHLFVFLAVRNRFLLNKPQNLPS